MHLAKYDCIYLPGQKERERDRFEVFVHNVTGN